MHRYDPELAPAVPFLPDLDLSDIGAARSTLAALVTQMGGEPDTSALQIASRSIAGPEGEIALRIYTPRTRDAALPGLLHIHGGGFVMGSIDAEHANAASVASALGIVVVSVGYRLAPEHPYPAGLHDCEAAFLWAVAHAGELGIDAARFGVYGQSAGGGLSAALCLLRRDRGGPQPCCQFLGIPELDDRLGTPSMRAFTDTPMWSRPKAELSWRYYLGAVAPGSAEVPVYAAPARATDLAGLPPAYVTTMEFDPLRDEGILYAHALMQAGVPTELHCYAGTFHGSSVITEAAISRRQWNDTLAMIARGLDLPLPVTG